MGRVPGPGGGFERAALDRSRLRFYRVILCLAIALLIAGGRGPPARLLSTALVYLFLGMVGVALHLGVRDGAPARPGLWPFALGLDVAAQTFVLARMGGP